MKRIPALIVILLLFSLSIPSTAYSTTGSYRNLAGNSVDLSSYQGKYVLLDGMATWCGPCELQMKHLQDVYDATKENSNVTILSISFDEKTDTLKKVENFKNKFEAKWEFGLEQADSLNHSLEIKVYPTTYLLNPSGDVIKKWTGITTSQEILTEMDKHLDLPGEFRRELRNNQFIKTLIQSPFVAFFLVMLWLGIFVFIAKLIKTLRSGEVEG